MGHASVTTGRRAGLTRQVVARAALDIIDHEGLGALTMRSLARSLGVTPMAIYNHIASRDDLDRAVVDELFAVPMPASEGVAIRDQLRSVAVALRDVYVAHPNAVPLIQTVPTSAESSLGLLERSLDVLVEGGVAIDDARTIVIGLIAIVNGHVAYEAQGHFSDVSVADDLPASLPQLASAVRAGPVDHEAAFLTTLDAFLAGVLGP